MTKDFTARGICQAKKGLLFLRDCGAAATAQCHQCGRPICQSHQVPSEKGPQCPECVAQTAPGDSTTETTTGGRGNIINRARTRRGYYDRYHYMPYYYGRSHYYSDRDYRTFDDARADEAVAAVEDIEGAEDSDFGDLDDFMES